MSNCPKCGFNLKSINCSMAFQSFWIAYPRKKMKGQAVKAWEKKQPDLKTVLEALEKAKRSTDWTKDGGTYIPYPATWINAEGWEDDYDYKPETREDRDRRLLAELS